MRGLVAFEAGAERVSNWAGTVVRGDAVAMTMIHGVITVETAGSV